MLLFKDISVKIEDIFSVSTPLFVQVIIIFPLNTATSFPKSLLCCVISYLFPPFFLSVCSMSSCGIHFLPFKVLSYFSASSTAKLKLLGLLQIFQRLVLNYCLLFIKQSFSFKIYINDNHTQETQWFPGYPIYITVCFLGKVVYFDGVSFFLSFFSG